MKTTSGFGCRRWFSTNILVYMTPVILVQLLCRIVSPADVFIFFFHFALVVVIGQSGAGCRLAVGDSRLYHVVGIDFAVFLSTVVHVQFCRPHHSCTPNSYYSRHTAGAGGAPEIWQREKVGQLILMRIIEIVAIRCQILGLECTKFDFGWTPLGEFGPIHLSCI